MRIRERIRISPPLLSRQPGAEQSQTTPLPLTPLNKINVGGTLFETRRQWFESLENETPLRLMVLGPAEADAEAGEGSAKCVPFLDRDADTF